MGDFRKNPKKPFEVPVPNKIRKRIVMHEKSTPKLNMPKLKWRKIVGPTTPVVKKRGSMWSRFTNRIKKFLNG